MSNVVIFSRSTKYSDTIDSLAQNNNILVDKLAYLPRKVSNLEHLPLAIYNTESSAPFSTIAGARHLTAEQTIVAQLEICVQLNIHLKHFKER